MQESGMSYSMLAVEARNTAADHLRAAIEAVEEQMGKGAASKYPQIVAALVTSSALDYHASMLSHRIAPSMDGIADSLRDAGASVASGLLGG